MNSGPLVHYLPFFSAAIAIEFCSWRQMFSFPSHPPPLDIFIWSPRMNGLMGGRGGTLGSVVEHLHSMHQGVSHNSEKENTGKSKSTCQILKMNIFVIFTITFFEMGF